jgi:hypothetical protein
VGLSEGLAHLLELAGGLIGPEVDRGANTGGTEIEGLLDRGRRPGRGARSTDPNITWSWRLG